MSIPRLERHFSPGASVEQVDPGHWRLSIPAGGAGAYRLAQMDDYADLRRADFPWQPPIVLSLSGRSSGRDLPGTWGFGLWNDPFGAGLAHGGTRAVPALPQAAWFFIASKQNHLSFGRDKPAAGALAGTFRSSNLVLWPFLPLALAAPLILIRPMGRLARRLASGLIQEDAAALDLDVTEWHAYRFEWQADGVRFWIDEREVFQTPVSPRPPLGLALWIDNQFAAWYPDGRVRYGTLQTSSAWIEIKDLTIA